MKERFRKTYRLPALDEKLTTRRTLQVNTVGVGLLDTVWAPAVRDLLRRTGLATHRPCESCVGGGLSYLHRYLYSGSVSPVVVLPGGEICVYSSIHAYVAGPQRCQHHSSVWRLNEQYHMHVRWDGHANRRRGAC